MASQSGPQDLDVSRSFLGEELRARPGLFEFFQAVRLMHRLLGERAPVGRFANPAREALWFSANNLLAFPPSQIHSLDWSEDGPARMKVNFMGLTGPMGVLPRSYTELIRDRNRAKDHTLQDFFDLFNHRMISLFYQAWEKYRFFVAYERAEQDRFSRYIMSFVGLGTPGLEDRQPVADESLLFYCGLLGLQARSAAALEQILADYFDVPVEIEQYVGAWYPLDPGNQCRMEGGTPYSDQLGFGAVAGDEIWDRQSRARIRLGPLGARQYTSFLPSGDAWQPLCAIARFFSGGEIEFEVQLVLKRDEVPSCELRPEADPAPRLGWLSWIKSGPAFGRDPGDTVLLLN
ncbi:MAG TPA: type VI secretion system baseplate subunit TssG [Bryobacteraceae bacterium]|nr:type VI secretion system baseplate subunit TssG [Bryobacteraceae bacterium]